MFQVIFVNNNKVNIIQVYKMSFEAKVYKVMIASPSDVVIERNIIREIITQWNIINTDTRKIVLLAVGWETHSAPEMGDKPQTIINKRILKDCDLLVGVFWTRIGTATDGYESGTIEEIEEHIKAGKPVMLYFSNTPVHPDSVDNEQYKKLKEFERSCLERGLYEKYIDQNEFKEKFYRQLQIKLNKDEYFSANSYTEELIIKESFVTKIPEISREAKIILIEAAQDYHGLIYKFRDSSGTSIQTNGKQLVEGNNAREIAIWESALEELEREGLVQPEGYKGEAYKVTKEGYDIADLLNL